MPTEIELFDGRPLTGWHAIPRLYSPVYVGGPPLSLDTAEYREQAIRHPARWSVQDGAIVGEQWPTGSGYGGFLLSDASFADFEAHARIETRLAHGLRHFAPENRTRLVGDPDPSRSP